MNKANVGTVLKKVGNIGSSLSIWRLQELCNIWNIDEEWLNNVCCIVADLYRNKTASEDGINGGS